MWLDLPCYKSYFDSEPIIPPKKNDYLKAFRILLLCQFKFNPLFSLLNMDQSLFGSPVKIFRHSLHKSYEGSVPGGVSTVSME